MGGAEETSHSLCAVGGGMTAQRTLLAIATLLAALGAVCLIAVPLGRAGAVPAADLELLVGAAPRARLRPALVASLPFGSETFPIGVSERGPPRVEPLRVEGANDENADVSEADGPQLKVGVKALRALRVVPGQKLVGGTETYPYWERENTGDPEAFADDYIDECIRNLYPAPGHSVSEAKPSGCPGAWDSRVWSPIRDTYDEDHPELNVWPPP